MALPLGTLSGLSGQLDSIAAMLKNAPLGIMGASAMAPPKQTMETTPFGSVSTTGVPAKQIPNMDFGTESSGLSPQKQGPADLSYGFGQQQTVPQLHANPGQVASLGGEFGVLDQFNNAFQQAGARFGIDPNWLKSLAATERGWEGTSVAGAMGIMQIMPGGYPQLEAMFPNWQHDPNQNIMLGAAILDAKRREQGGDLNRGTMGYLGFATDAYGTTPDVYLGKVNQYYSQLQGSGGSFASGGAGWTAAFGGSTVPDWGEFGVESDNGFYGYGTAYGMNGTQHTGVDVPMTRGSVYRAPVSGTVTCAGTGIGPGADGKGCSAFSSYDANGNPIPGAGRVEIKLDNGAVLIFGHSDSAAVQVGQRVNAGQPLGTVGFMVSPHVHLEARVPDPTTGSGYRIVDPRSVIGGGAGVGYGVTSPSPTGSYGSVAQDIRNWRMSR